MHNNHFFDPRRLLPSSFVLSWLVMSLFAWPIAFFIAIGSAGIGMEIGMTWAKIQNPAYADRSLSGDFSIDPALGVGLITAAMGWWGGFIIILNGIQALFLSLYRAQGLVWLRWGMSGGILLPSIVYLCIRPFHNTFTSVFFITLLSTLVVHAVRARHMSEVNYELVTIGIIEGGFMVIFFVIILSIFWYIG